MNRAREASVAVRIKAACVLCNICFDHALESCYDRYPLPLCPHKTSLSLNTETQVSAKEAMVKFVCWQEGNLTVGRRVSRRYYQDLYI